MQRHVLMPTSQVGLHPDEHTIADHLRSLGYATACFGKWHLGHLPEVLPRAQGFGDGHRDGDKAGHRSSDRPRDEAPPSHEDGDGPSHEDEPGST
jgi:arylsulfatase A-like enzyme